MPPSSLHSWRSWPDEIDMRFRIVDLGRPRHMPIEKLTLLTTSEVVYSTVDNADEATGVHRSAPHGWWHCTFDATIHTRFNLRGTEVELRFQLLDNSDCYQNISTPEVLLVPWNSSPERGPTVRSAAQSQFNRRMRNEDQ